MSDRVTQYQSAFASLTQAQQRASAIVATVSSLARTVRDWQRLNITGARIPDPLTIDPNIPCISPQDWPSFDDFRDAVSAYHEASSTVHNIWLNMHEDEKAGLSPPP